MFFSKIKESFSNTINNIFNSNKEIDEIIDEIEETLVCADIGIETSMEICDNLRKRIKGEKDKSEENVKKALREEMINILSVENNESEENNTDKKCILVVGVNGVGKTTSIAKIANRYKNQGKKVLLVAGDTFRAGAVEQLKVWADRLGIDCITGRENADPSSVMFDGSKEFINSNYDILICDTAGRLHNKKNLMDELDKMKRTIEKNIDSDKIEVYMVLDSTTGQNGISQVKSFYERTSIDGIVLTKLDSTSKGGVVFSILKELNIPIKYIGTGEKVEDISVFNAKEFVEAILKNKGEQ